MPTHSSFTPLPITGIDRGGKRRYDPQAKRALIEACLEPGTSLAGLALAHGVNANLLRKWVVKHQRQVACEADVIAPAASVFVPVIIGAQEPISMSGSMATPVTAPPHQPSRLQARLPNGVTLELACDQQDTTLLSALIDALGRCDVPAAR
ncbi:IS66-like element accessory protein TnpA [Noviherbaspirillum soli]|uniref:IS66-like element accessory protein TnpA n=1 Tax=Noviherbaspirillum soli TaxID=1064518 RepID=UPI00188A350E|nr:transposase [Noviherbaspirillum soli]